MATGVVVFLTISILFVLTTYTHQRLALKAKAYDDMPNHIQIFRYSNEMRIVESMIWFLFTVLCAIVFTMVIIDDGFVLWQAVVFGAIVLLLLVITIYRWIVTKQETIVFRDGYLLYYRGRQKLKEINLRRVDDVQMFRFGQLHIQMVDGSIVKLPLGFREQGYIYKILKEYRYHAENLNENRSF